jgi:hypothetical protein
MTALPDSGLVASRGISQSVRGEIGSWLASDGQVGARIFVNGMYDRGTRDAGGYSEYTYASSDIVAGIYGSPRSDVLIGLFGGHVLLDGDFDQQGSFENEGFFVGGLAGWKNGSLSLSGQAYGARSRVTDVRRYTGFLVMPVADSESRGWIGGGEFEARWAQAVGSGVSVSEFVRLSAAVSTLDGFSESGAEYLNINVNESSASEWVAAAGLSASLPLQFGATQGSLLATVSYEVPLDGKAEVHGTLSSGQAIGSSADYGGDGIIAGSTRLLVGLPESFDLSLVASAGVSVSTGDYYVLPSVGLSRSF